LKITFVDVETTGLLRDPDARIVEVAMSSWENGKSVERCSSLIRGADAISPEITRINGITAEMIRDAPSFEEYWKEKRGLFVDAMVIAHNLSFDMGMINRELFRSGRVPLGNRGIDTVPLSRKFLPNIKSYRLGEIAKELGVINESPHRALGDLDALEKIVSRMLETSPPLFDSGILALFCQWGAYSSHRYFKDVAMLGFERQIPLELTISPGGRLDRGESISIRPTRVHAVGLSGEGAEGIKDFPFDSLVEIGIRGHEPGSVLP
jgi:DNA polymerase-3 subunit epsilon